MSVAVPLRQDFSADDLRWLARASRDAGQSRRLLALAVIYDSGRRTEAAWVGAAGLQTVRDWVLAFNADGLRGWSSFDKLRMRGKAPGQRPKLDAAQRQALAGAVEQGPNPERDGVVRWRRKDLAAWLYARFRVRLDKTTVGRELKKLGFAKMSARPRHYVQDPAALVALKKGAARRGGGDPS